MNWLGKPSTGTGGGGSLATGWEQLLGLGVLPKGYLQVLESATAGSQSAVKDRRPDPEEGMLRQLRIQVPGKR